MSFIDTIPTSESTGSSATFAQTLANNSVRAATPSADGKS
jgi:hypothetical protein